MLHQNSMEKKNPDIRPFESGGSEKIEFFCRKNDASLFVVGTHNKKRPHNLIMGRMFDGHLLDMVEMGIDETSLKLMADFKESLDLGTKPCLLFSGAAFEQDESMKRFQ